MHPLLIKGIAGGLKMVAKAWEKENQERQSRGQRTLQAELAASTKKAFRKTKKELTKLIG